MKTLDRDTVVKEILQILKGIDNRKMRDDDKIPQRIGLYGLKEDLKTLIEDVTKGSSLGVMSLDSHRVQIISHTQKTKFAFINKDKQEEYRSVQSTHKTVHFPVLEIHFVEHEPKDSDYFKYPHLYFVLYEKWLIKEQMRKTFNPK